MRWQQPFAFYTASKNKIICLLDCTQSVDFFAFQIVFFKWAIPGLFSFIFFVSNNINFFTKNICEKCLSCIQCWDSNPLLSGHESPHITNRPVLPPKNNVWFKNNWHLNRFQMQILLLTLWSDSWMELIVFVEDFSTQSVDSLHQRQSAVSDTFCNLQDFWF